MDYRQQMLPPFQGPMQQQVPDLQFFPGFPGQPGGQGLERRVSQLENQVRRMQNQINRLNRRVTRLENQFGFPRLDHEEIGYY